MIGLGGVGLSSLLGASALSARAAWLRSTLSDDKLGLAAPARCNRYVQPWQSRMQSTEIRAATGGGVEFAFEMAGSVRAMDLASQDHAPRRGTDGHSRVCRRLTHTLRAACRSTSSPRSGPSRAATSAPACRRAICRATSSSIGEANYRWTG